MFVMDVMIFYVQNLSDIFIVTIKNVNYIIYVTGADK